MLSVTVSPTFAKHGTLHEQLNNIASFAILEMHLDRLATALSYFFCDFLRFFALLPGGRLGGTGSGDSKSVNKPVE